MRAGRCGANPNPNLSATPAGPHAIFCAGVAGVVFLYTANSGHLPKYAQAHTT